MLKFFNYDIVFAEIPNEVTLAVNISGCPNHCRGCHSPWLWEDRGETLDEDSIAALLADYGNTITCFGFMGGDAEPKEVERLAGFVKGLYPKLKIGWYSGKPDICKDVDISLFQYVKVGGYQAEYGSLKSRTTNQRLYKILPNNQKEDITYLFWN
jgi:anaerobic ribonucleoside-triphosphate reductase activating protein